MDEIKRELGLIKRNIRNLSARVANDKKLQKITNKNILNDINNLANAEVDLYCRLDALEEKIQSIEDNALHPVKVVGFQIEDNREEQEEEYE